MGTVRESATVSVCIPAYNEERNVGALLRFLHGCGRLSGRIVEVLVDVSGSTDQTAAAVRREAAEWSVIRVVDTGHRDGLLHALDRLIGQAKGDRIVRMDADVQISEDSLLRLVERLDDPSIGIVGGRVRPAQGRSRWVNLISASEWEVHHQVCLRSPKTTIVQVFRWGIGRLPRDSGLEDAALQDCVSLSGRLAAYDPRSEVLIMPPATVRGLVEQRVRTILHTRRHIRRGYPIPSTASIKLVADSLTATAREGSSLLGLLLFCAMEAGSRLIASYRSWFTSTTTFRWEPVEGTKELNWPAHVPVGMVERAHSVSADRLVGP